MTLEIRRTRQVSDDMIKLYGFVHVRSPQGAERLIAAIWNSLNALRDTPGVGRRYDTDDPRLEGLRVTTVTPYRNYLIFFRPTDKAIEVFRIIQGSQQLDRIVGEIDVDFES